MEETASNLASISPPLKWVLLRKPHWGGDVSLTVTAHEQTCNGPEVDRQVVVFAAGVEDEQSVMLETPDMDADGYVPLANGGTDCDDSIETGASAFPGHTEVCDAVDNDCDQVLNEGFTVLYPDGDGDGEGDSSQPSCEGALPPPEFVANGRDCDDSDPGVKTTAAEVCDAIDNNCKGGVDEVGDCGGTLREVADFHLRGPGGDAPWRTVAMSPANGGYPVWIAGLGGQLVVRKAANERFESFSFGASTTTPPPDGSPPASPNHCGNYGWYASWVDSEGAVYLGGASGRVAIHDGETCAFASQLPVNDTVVGMVGFENGFDTIVYMATDAGQLFYWRTFEWNLGRPPQSTPNSSREGHRYTGLHGFSENLTQDDNEKLWVSAVTGGKQAVLTYFTGDDSLNVQSLDNPGDISGAMNAVWARSSTTACAVGDQGGVWRKSGVAQWTQQSVPPRGAVDFSSVVMLSNGDCYIVDKSNNGRLHRLTGKGWAKGPSLPAHLTDKPLHDLAMETAANFWIVGDGRVLHYPEP
ncbi:putative metal-binding motif-containing protein [Myxococcus sp. CA039A]|uniref:putative metal-binding motif-containing protein n=1 Tax=Myxococcus sp. CA039A TaxID=2741737 RepID=UPI00157B2A58|nr:putative metal-binding motif-containing protein [Myxococcus sp. CA039A]